MIWCVSLVMSSSEICWNYCGSSGEKWIISCQQLHFKQTKSIMLTYKFVETHYLYVLGAINVSISMTKGSALPNIPDFSTTTNFSSFNEIPKSYPAKWYTITYKNVYIPTIIKCTVTEFLFQRKFRISQLAWHFFNNLQELFH